MGENLHGILLDNHRYKSLKDRSSKSSGSSSGVARSKSLKGTVSSYLMSKRKAEWKMNFGDLVSTAMKSRYKIVEEAGYLKIYSWKAFQFPNYKSRGYYLWGHP